MATVHVDLTSDEQSTIAALEARFSERAHFPITLEKLLSSWRIFVAEVEQGYESTIDDYTNDLSTRDLLGNVLREVSPDLKTRLLVDVESLDRRFEHATRPDAGNRIAEFIEPGEGWWWSRLPRKLGALANDIGAA